MALRDYLPSLERTSGTAVAAGLTAAAAIGVGMAFFPAFASAVLAFKVAGYSLGALGFSLAANTAIVAGAGGAAATTFGAVAYTAGSFVVNGLSRLFSSVGQAFNEAYKKVEAKAKVDEVDEAEENTEGEGLEVSSPLSELGNGDGPGKAQRPEYEPSSEGTVKRPEAAARFDAEVENAAGVGLSM